METKKIKNIGSVISVEYPECCMVDIFCKELDEGNKQGVKPGCCCLKSDIVYWLSNGGFGKNVTYLMEVVENKFMRQYKLPIHIQQFDMKYAKCAALTTDDGKEIVIIFPGSSTDSKTSDVYLSFSVEKKTFVHLKQKGTWEIPNYQQDMKWLVVPIEKKEKIYMYAQGKFMDNRMYVLEALTEDTIKWSFHRTSSQDSDFIPELKYSPPACVYGKNMYIFDATKIHVFNIKCMKWEKIIPIAFEMDFQDSSIVVIEDYALVYCIHNSQSIFAVYDFDNNTWFHPELENIKTIKLKGGHESNLIQGPNKAYFLKSSTMRREKLVNFGFCLLKINFESLETPMDAVNDDTQLVE